MYIPLIFAGVSVCSLCAFAGGSSSRAARKSQNTKKRARRGKPSDDNEDSHEVVIPTKATRREKSAAAKQRVAVPMHKWKMSDWQRFCLQDPYTAAPNPRWNNPRFRNELHMRIMSEIFEHHKNKFTQMWSIDIDHLRNNLDYFGEALEIYEEFDLIKLMSINCDFDVHLSINFMQPFILVKMMLALSHSCVVMSSFKSLESFLQCSWL